MFETLLTVPLLLSFYLVIAFLASEPAAALRATGKAIPASWEAVVPNHGGYLPGFLPSEHPAFCAASIAAFGAFAFIVLQLRNAQAAQLRDASPQDVRRHKIARFFNIAAFAVMVWLQLTQVLPRIAAA